MHADLVQELTKLGLQDREAKVYLILLQQGRSTAQAIAQAAEMPRASCYGMLESLASKELITVWTDREQREYVAAPPERLRTLLRLQAEELQARMQGIEFALPQLLALATDTTAKPQVRLFKGVQDLRQLQEEFRELSGERLQIVGYDALMSLRSVRQAAEKEHGAIRKEGKQSGRVIIVTDHHVSPDVFETRTLPASMLNVPGEVTVCGDRVFLLGYQDDVVAVEIRSPAIAQTCKALLELAWSLAGDLEQKFKGR